MVFPTLVNSLSDRTRGFFSRFAHSLIPCLDTALFPTSTHPIGGSRTNFSYDPASGTYLGYDGLRHPCPRELHDHEGKEPAGAREAASPCHEPPQRHSDL